MDISHLVAILFAIAVRWPIHYFWITIIDANIDNNLFRNFLIFIWSFQHASETLKNELQGSNRFRYLSVDLM